MGCPEVLPMRQRARSLSVTAMWLAKGPATRPVGWLCCDLRHRCWPHARAGAWVAVAVIAALAPAGVLAAQPGLSGLGPPANVTLVSAVRAAAADQASDYTLMVTPSSVTANSSVTFTLTFTADVNFDGGTVYLQVPAGWDPPVQTGGQGEVTCEAGCPAGVSLNGTTIVIPDLANVPVITVTYLATVPDSASTGTFTTAAQLTDRGAIQPSVTEQVSVSASTISPSQSPTTTTPSQSATTTTPSQSATTTSAPTSPSSSPIGGSGSRVPGQLVAGVAIAGIASLLLAVWLVRRRPVLAAAQSVRAVPHTGRPAEFSVRVTGAEPTRTVRIEPHSGTATTSIMEVEP
jgi:hypothetical protein